MTTPDKSDKADQEFRRRRARRRRWQRIGVTFGVVAVLIGGPALLRIMSSQTLIAYVSCTSGDPVVGVWMEGMRLGHVWRADTNSGFAQISALPSPSNDVKAIWTRHYGGGVAVGVGCGGSPAAWLRVGQSGPTTLTRMIIICDDQRPVDGSYVCTISQG